MIRGFTPSPSPRKLLHARYFSFNYTFRRGARNRNQRFFLYLPLQIPHANSERGRRLGDGMQIPSYEPYSAREWPVQEKGFAAMVTRMDSDVGRLMDVLGELGLDTNTLILFTSDNGPHPEGGHKPDYFGSSGP